MKSRRLVVEFEIVYNNVKVRRKTASPVKVFKDKKKYNRRRDRNNYE